MHARCDNVWLEANFVMLASTWASQKDIDMPTRQTTNSYLMNGPSNTKCTIISTHGKLCGKKVVSCIRGLCFMY